MSYSQYFEELQAVAQVLQGFVDDVEDPPTEGDPADAVLIEISDEEFTACWQAAELLIRASTVLLPLLALDLAKSALVLPDPKVTDDEQ